MRDHTASFPLRVIEIVDDDRNTRQMYGDHLAIKGFRVLHARTRGEGFTRACDAQPDVLVTEVGLPTIDGWELIRRLKADRRTRHIPIVLLTAWAAPAIHEYAHQLGCTRVLTKPCLPEVLATEIDGILASVKTSHVSNQAGPSLSGE